MVYFYAVFTCHRVKSCPLQLDYLYIKNNYIINIQIGHDLPIKQCYSFYSQNSLIYLELEGEGKQTNKQTKKPMRL